MGGQTVYERSPKVIARNVADRMVLVPVFEKVGDEDYIFSLDEVGARIWHLLDGSRTIEQVEKQLLSEFDASPEELKKDLEEFVSDLESAGLIQTVDDKPSKSE